MRLVACTLTAVLLSGCSWLGTGGHGGGHGSAGGAYGVNCTPAQGGYGQMQQTQYSYGGGGAGCAGSAFGLAGNGYGPGAGHGGAGYGGAGYGPGAGYGGAGFGGAGYGPGAGDQGAGLGLRGPMDGYGAAGAGYGAYGGTTTLDASAPYGSAFGGAYGSNVVGTQMANGQWVDGANVQTIQGAPIYVPQPYPAYYAAGGSGYSYGHSQSSSYGQSAGGGAMPFGFEAAGGTEFGIGGNIFTEKAAGPAAGNPAVNTGGSEGISYNDAFGQMKSIGGNLAYDVSRNTTVLGGVTYGSADGGTAENYQTVDARTPGTLEGLDAEFSDLELWTIQGGVRQYVGYNPVVRPYVGATAGFTHNNDVTMNRTFSSDGVAYDPAPINYVQSGWNPTAAAVVGAEMAVGKRAAIGVESGIRWNDNMKTSQSSEDRWSIPVSLRGRVAF